MEYQDVWSFFESKNSVGLKFLQHYLDLLKVHQNVSS